MAEDFGTGVSRTLSAVDRSFETVVLQKGKPPLDSELNLYQQVQSEGRAQALRALMPSGFLGDAFEADRIFKTSNRFSNLFYFGDQNGWSLNNDGDWVAKSIHTNIGTASISGGTLTDGTADFTALLSVADLAYATVDVTSGVNAGLTFTISARGATTLTLGGSPTNDASVAYTLRFHRFVLEPTVWAHVNGWVVPVVGTKVGSLPLSPNDTDTRNQIRLYPPPTGTATMRADFVFLEVWRAQISPNPSTANKPSATELWKHGNVLGGMTPFADDLIDPAITFETSERVQVQYRIRVVSDVDLTTWQAGFDTAKVFGWGTTTANTSFTFTNMKDQLNDPGLWRAGDGDASNALDTVDGYSYAVPICAVFRRNSSAYSESGSNLLGGFNRNGGAADPDDAKIFTQTELDSFDASLDRPDRLAADQITSTDILDLRHHVNSSGFDYMGLLQHNVAKLLKGNLRSTWKTSYGGYRGPVNYVVDQILTGALTSPPANISGLDGFDGKRRVFSDTAVMDPFQARAWLQPASTIPASDAGISAAQDGVYARSAVIDLLAQSRDDFFRATFATPANYMPTVGAAVSPALGGSLEAFDTWGGDIFRLKASSLNTAFSDGGTTTYTQAARFMQPGSRLEFAPHALSIFIEGDTTDYAQTGFDDATDDATSPTMWCTGAIIDGSHAGNSLDPANTTGVARSAAGLTGAISTSGPDQLFTFDATTYSGAAGSAWPTPLAVGQLLTIGNPADLLDNGTYEILEIVSDVAPVIVRVNRTTAWNTAGGSIVWDRAYNDLNPSRDLVVRLSNNFPQVDATSLDYKLRISASVMYGPGRGLSRLPLAIYSAGLLNLGPNYLVADPADPTLTPRHFRSAPYSVAQSPRAPSSVQEFRLAPMYADLGSKTVMLQPWQPLTLPPTEILDGTALHGGDGLMPLKASDPDIDNELLFGPKAGDEKYLVLDWHSLGVRLSRGTASRKTYMGLDIPIRAAADGDAWWSAGLNFFLPEVSAVPSPGLGTWDNSDVVWTNDESNGTATFLTLATHDDSGTPIAFNFQQLLTYGVNTVRMTAGIRHTSFTVDGGTTVRGLEMPYYFGPGRVWAIYERSDYQANGSNYNATTRGFVAANSTNLLVESSDVDTLWFSIDENGDGTFILPEKLISGYDPSTEYIVECSPFAFDRDFMVDENVRILLTKSPPSGDPYTVGTFHTLPVFTVPQAPDNSVAARIRYVTTPYQGDVNGTQQGFQDRGQRHGQILSDWVNGVLTDPVDTSSSELLTNPTHFEVLAGIGFVTNAGTGLISGMAETGDASRDIRTFQAFQPGREEIDFTVDPADPPFRVFANAHINDPMNPPTSGNPLNATTSLKALRVYNTQHTGAVAHLPLGVFLRDHSFVGGLLVTGQDPLLDEDFDPDLEVRMLCWSSLWGSSQLGGAAAPLVPDDHEIFPSDVLAQQTIRYDQVVKPGDVVTLVDANSDPSDILNDGKFRTNRGKAAFISRGSTPGAAMEIALSPSVARNQAVRNPILTGVVLLVRSLPERVGARTVHHGGELQMLILTSANASMADWRAPSLVGSDRLNSDAVIPLSAFIGANGLGEGLSAIDRFRLTGHPLVKGHDLQAPRLEDITLAPPGSGAFGSVVDQPGGG